MVGRGGAGEGGDEACCSLCSSQTCWHRQPTLSHASPRRHCSLVWSSRQGEVEQDRLQPKSGVNQRHLDNISNAHGLRKGPLPPWTQTNWSFFYCLLPSKVFNLIFFPLASTCFHFRPVCNKNLLSREAIRHSKNGVTFRFSAKLSLLFQIITPWPILRVKK